MFDLIGNPEDRFSHVTAHMRVFLDKIDRYSTIIPKFSDTWARASREETQTRLHCLSFEPRSEKTGLRGFRPGPTQTGLYSHRMWIEA